MKFINKKISIFSIFLCFFLNCKESKTKEKLSINIERKQRILAYKITVDSLNKTLDWKKTNFDLWKSKNGDLGLKTLEGTEQGIEIEKFITELSDGTPLKKIIDTTTFKFLGSSFYKDKNHVYTHFLMVDGGNFWIVENADTKSFKVLGDCYAKDNKRIFAERNMHADTIFDYHSFKTCKGCGSYAKDKNGFYFWDEKIKIDEIDNMETKNTIEKLKKL